MTTSVVIPTRNEAANVRALLARMCPAVQPDDEILFVDDGSDDLPEVVAVEAARYPQHIHVHRRLAGTGGLSGAVVEGIHRTRGEHVVVCDGDLQHPPEVIPHLVAGLLHSDVVVASRYCEGGDADGLSGWTRSAVSRSTGLLSRMLFPRRLRGCSDPMSGFFAVRRNSVDLASLRPRGFKILLEFLVRHRNVRLSEVPFVFGEREAGQSHATAGQGLRFLQQVAAARFGHPAIGYALVGVSGVIPNLATVAALTHEGVHYSVAMFVATQVAILWNFLGAELVVWRHRRVGPFTRRAAAFFAVGELDLLRIPFAVLLVRYAGFTTVLATAVTLLAAFALRFMCAERLVYRRRPTIITTEEVLDVAV